MYAKPAGESGRELLQQAYGGGVVQEATPVQGVAFAQGTPVQANAVQSTQYDYGAVPVAAQAQPVSGNWGAAAAVPAGSHSSVPAVATSSGWGAAAAPAQSHTSMNFGGGGFNGASPFMPNPGSGVNRSFFVDYASTCEQIENLQFVDKGISNCSASIKNLQQQISTLENKLGRARRDQPKLEARIHRNENPHFFHYMQIGRADKVTRLKNQLETLKGDQLKWSEEKHQQEAQLQQRKTELGNLRNSEGSRNALRQKRQQMYNQTVSSVPATPRIQQITSNISSQKNALQSEKALLSQVDAVVAQINQAQQLYSTSMGMLQRAMGANQTAQFTNFVGDGGGMEFYETMNQAERDNLINQSQMPANQGYMAMSNAWQVFPNEARQRYPDLAARCGKTPMPRLRGANFGNTLATGMVFGDIGDMFNNMHANQKIQENMQIIQQSLAIVAEQLQLVMALRNAIATNIAAMEGQMSKLIQQDKEERDVIFQNVRATVLSAGS
mmetsp:Transcript_26305/g.42610  ORF Transcript_26305/g.42610 Transcript_26305/m.42610 type:complete len:498 (+) Transcript_26305:58-1551(+)